MKLYKCDSCAATIERPRNVEISADTYSGYCELCEPCHDEIVYLIRARTGGSRIVTALKLLFTKKARTVAASPRSNAQEGGGDVQ